jgi:hypothetical protein
MDSEVAADSFLAAETAARNMQIYFAGGIMSVFKIAVTIGTVLVASACGNFVLGDHTIPESQFYTPDGSTTTAPTTSTTSSTTGTSTGTSSGTTGTSTGTGAHVSFAQVQQQVVLPLGCTGCHSGFDTYAVFASDAATILSRLQAGTMPPGGGASSAQTQLVQQWIAAGTPQN